MQTGVKIARLEEPGGTTYLHGDEASLLERQLDGLTVEIANVGHAEVPPPIAHQACGDAGDVRSDDQQPATWMQALSAEPQESNRIWHVLDNVDERDRVKQPSL